jgi:hypothetical protein
MNSRKDSRSSPVDLTLVALVSTVMLQAGITMENHDPNDPVAVYLSEISGIEPLA